VIQAKNREPKFSKEAISTMKIPDCLMWLWRDTQLSWATLEPFMARRLNFCI
jgi:hypothetical protein